MQDLVAGQIDMMIAADVTTSVTQVRAGTIKAFAIAGKSRLASVPDVPTSDEAGLPGFYSTPWYGFWVPVGTPKPIIAKLNAAVAEALADTTVRGGSPTSGSRFFRASSKHPKGSPHCKSRHREVGADHQGRRGQGGIGRSSRIHVETNARHG
jgi:tripartite-type tricarboxylate transporter receptor subunit TctC